jgi:hypothetical protein
MSYPAKKGNLSYLFADDVEGPFIGAQSQKGRMPHLAFARPLGEVYLADELGNKPRGRFLVLHFLVEGFVVGAQRLHRSIERLERHLVEARADMTGIDPALRCFVAYCKHKRSDAPGSSRTRSSPLRNAFGGQVIDSTARPRCSKFGSVSPVCT